MTLASHGIPVVGSEESDGLVEALSGVGFAAVRGHHVPESDLAAMRRLLVALFDVDDGAKDRQSVSRDDYRGYIPLRSSHPTGTRRRRRTASRATSCTGNAHPTIRCVPNAPSTVRTAGPTTFRRCRQW